MTSMTTGLTTWLYTSIWRDNGPKTLSKVNVLVLDAVPPTRFVSNTITSRRLSLHSIIDALFCFFSRSFTGLCDREPEMRSDKSKAQREHGLPASNCHLDVLTGVSGSHRWFFIHLVGKIEKWISLVLSLFGWCYLSLVAVWQSFSLKRNEMKTLWGWIGGWCWANKGGVEIAIVRKEYRAREHTTAHRIAPLHNLTN